MADDVLEKIDLAIVIDDGIMHVESSSPELIASINDVIVIDNDKAEVYTLGPIIDMTEYTRHQIFAMCEASDDGLPTDDISGDDDVIDDDMGDDA